MLYGLIRSTIGLAITLVISVPMITANKMEKPYLRVRLKKHSTTDSTTMGMVKFSSPKAVKNLATPVKNPHCMEPKNRNTHRSKA